MTGDGWKPKTGMPQTPAEVIDYLKLIGDKRSAGIVVKHFRDQRELQSLAKDYQGLALPGSEDITQALNQGGVHPVNYERYGNGYIWPLMLGIMAHERGLKVAANEQNFFGETIRYYGANQLRGDDLLTFQLLFGGNRPDLYDLTFRKVAELKPYSYLNNPTLYATAKAQVELYRNNANQYQDFIGKPYDNWTFISNSQLFGQASERKLPFTVQPYGVDKNYEMTLLRDPNGDSGLLFYQLKEVRQSTEHSMETAKSILKNFNLDINGKPLPPSRPGFMGLPGGGWLPIVP